ncbi:MAG: ferrous iron transport protein A [Planctomycetota bacterium]|nr:MAG: ferrous iron transport protein A [Planctomycetota bacterium]
MSRNNSPLTLADLPRLRRGRVLRVDGGGALADRLRELGFAPDTEVVFLRRAPLGDPLLFRLRGTDLSLRRSEAARVVITLDEEPAPE